MSFDTIPTTQRKIAVIGAGISGMGAAQRLADTHRVTLFEAEPRLGGHARTIIAGKNGDQPVDTGFIVFNYANYPRLAEMFDALDVPVTPSNMSFGASIDGGRLEYGLAGLRAFFAQPRNAFDPRFLRMLRDVYYFNAHAAQEIGFPGETIGAFMDRLGMGKWFRDYYLLPLSGAIWSTPTQKIIDFPAEALVRFFVNHGLMGYSGQHQWYTVQGGSVAYVARLEADLLAKGADLRMGCTVAGVRRVPGGVGIRPKGGEWEAFDDVILATHSDDSLAMLSDPTADEARHLGAIRYQPNDIVLHADPSVMPQRRAVWSSWNYTERAGKRDGQIDLTYWMNRLQPIPQDDPHFVTLNTTRPIREDLIYDQVTLRHPVYDLGALAAQDAVRAMNGRGATWFCGAWMRDGFHEDGLQSALDVADAIQMQGARVAA